MNEVLMGVRGGCVVLAAAGTSSGSIFTVHAGAAAGADDAGLAC